MREGRPPTWRDRYPDEVTCVRCLDVYEQAYLDRLLWCERCRERARARAGWWGRLAGLAVGVGVALYVWITIRPTSLVIGGWIACVVAAGWIGSKIGKEIAYGVMRFENRRAAEATPPVLDDTTE